jgi:hypothetical protein
MLERTLGVGGLSRITEGPRRKPVTNLKTALAKGALVLTLASGALVATTTAASADVACNRYGECWRVREHYTNYPNRLGVTFYGDDWRRTHQGRRWHWRHDRDDDHGYYMHGRWHRF